MIVPKSYLDKKLENYQNYFKNLVEIKVIPDELKEINVNKYKGLVLIGGEDVNPKFYNEENAFSEVNEERDLVEFELLEKFLKYERVILSICRGIQVINVFFGGSLYQDIPNQLNSYIHKFYKNKTPKNIEIFNGDTYHKVKIISKNPLFEISEFIVNSRHHQAIKKLANDLEVFAISEDNIIEGVFHKKLPIFGVQWHPERIKYEYSSSSERILNFLKNDRF